MLKSVLIAAVMTASFSVSANYKINRSNDGGFMFELSGIKINEGSSLQRETIILNHPASGVELTSSNLKFSYKDRSFYHQGKTTLKLSKNVTAIQVRHALYDVFGKHVNNLSNTEAKDMAAGEHTLDASWRAPESHVSEVLTNVTYIARVRYEDGTQWVIDWEEISRELGKLQLEKLADAKELDK